MKDPTLSEIDLNRPPIRQRVSSRVALPAQPDCAARTPEMILDTWTHDIKSAYERLCAVPTDAKPPRPSVDIDDGAFPDLLFA